MENVKKNYIYNLIYQLTLIIVPIISTPYISRVIHAEGVGSVSFTQALTNYFVVFGTLGFTYYAQREIAKKQDDQHAQSILFFEILLCRLIPALTAITCDVILIVTGVYGTNTLLMLIFLTEVVAVVFDVTFLFQGNEEFGYIVLRSIIIKIIGTSCIFIFIKQSSDTWIYALINGLSTLAVGISLWPKVFKKISKVDIHELKPFRHFGPTLRLFIPTVAMILYTVFDRSLIGIITKSSAENGYYEQAEKIVKMILVIVTCLSTVMIPRNSNEYAKGNEEAVKNNIYNAIHFVWLLAIPMTCGIAIVASNMLPWFLGDGFQKSILLMQIFSPIVLFIGFSNVLGLQWLVPTKKDTKFTIAVTVGAILNIALNVGLINYYASAGAAIATIIAEFVIDVIMLCFVRKDLSIKELFKTSVKPIVASIVMIAACLPVSLYLQPSIINTLVLVTIGIVVYALMITLLRDNLVMSLFNKLFRKDKENTTK